MCYIPEGQYAGCGAGDAGGGAVLGGRGAAPLHTHLAGEAPGAGCRAAKVSGEESTCCFHPLHSDTLTL